MNPLTRFQHRGLEVEVDEELRFHVELQQREYIQRGMSLEQARAATQKRFGNLDKFKNECVTIRRRSSPLQRAFKLFVILLALTGLIVRIGGTDRHIDHIGTTLIAIAVSGRLLLYVRSLTPSRFLPGNKPSSPSIFN